MRPSIETMTTTGVIVAYRAVNSKVFKIYAYLWDKSIVGPAKISLTYIWVIIIHFFETRYCLTRLIIWQYYKMNNVILGKMALSTIMTVICSHIVSLSVNF